MLEEKKKILVVDDSALMRRVLCDIIDSDKRFLVTAKAGDGLEAFDLLSRRQFDGVVLDINMPRMNGLELLAELKKYKIAAKVLVASTDSKEGARVTLEALELGALDFIQKPSVSFKCRSEDFTSRFLELLSVVCGSAPLSAGGHTPALEKRGTVKRTGTSAVGKGNAIVAIASSTGGPKALQSVIPCLPQDLAAPVVLVQHMPKGFTASLAARLNELSSIEVREAQEGEALRQGVVYVAMGGRHLNVVQGAGAVPTVHYSDEPPREGVKPSANYMYESLGELEYSQVVCAVLTGMGADGTAGIRNLKEKKDVYVITQDAESCVVYGMPKNVVLAGLSDLELPLEGIAEKIVERVGLQTK